MHYFGDPTNIISRAHRNWKLGHTPSVLLPLDSHNDPCSWPFFSVMQCVCLLPIPSLPTPHIYLTLTLSFLIQLVSPGISNVHTNSSHPLHLLFPSIWFHILILRTLLLTFGGIDYLNVTGVGIITTTLRRKDLSLVNWVLTITFWRQGPHPPFVKPTVHSQSVSPADLEKLADS